MGDDIKAQILAELDDLVYQYPPRLKDDITRTDIMKSRGISRTCAMEFMQKIVKLNPDKYELVKVQLDAKNSTSFQWVLRVKK